jgi:hypothetical protein
MDITNVTVNVLKLERMSNDVTVGDYVAVLILIR